MSNMDIIERIGGRRTETGAHSPFVLDDRDQAYYVEHGHLEIFVTRVQAGQTVGRRHFVARVVEGEMAFGISLFTTGEHSFGLLAVPSQSTVIVQGARAGVAATDFDIHAVNWIDEWVSHLSEFLARERAQRQQAWLLEADPNIPYRAGSALSAQHRDIIWVSSDQPLRFLGRKELISMPGQPLLPLTERTWCELDADAQVSACYTPEALAGKRLWDGFDRFNTLVLEYSAMMEQEAVAGLRQQRQRIFQAKQRSIAAAMLGFGKLLGHAGNSDQLADKEETPLQLATKLVAEHCGASLEIPEHVSGESAGEIINILARRNGIKTRDLVLTPDWWRRDGPSFIGFKTGVDNTSRPLAILSDWRGRYRALDPETGGGVLNAATAKDIALHGVALYTPLPKRVEDKGALFRYAMQQRGDDLRLLIGAGILGGLLALMIPILTGQILANFIPRAEIALWVAALCALLLVAVGCALFEIVRALSLLRLEGRVDERLQSAIWSRLVSLPAPFFRNYTAGDLADRANGISELRQMLTGAVTQAALSGVFSIFSLALLFYYSWTLTLTVCALLLLLAGAIWFFSLGQLRHYREVFRTHGALYGFVFQMISGLAKLRVAHAENYALTHWAERYARQKQENLAALYWAAGQFVTGSVFTPLALILVLAFVHYQLLGGVEQPGFDLADFLSFNAAFAQLTVAVIGLTNAATTFVSALPLFERVQPILAAEPELSSEGVDPGILKGELEFANVSFRYAEDAPVVIDNMSFRINQGDYVAFVGSSGCGKSTIYRLLLGFEQPASGTVFLDGHDLASLNLTEVRRNMGVVLQNGRIMAGSIFENIAGMSPLTLNDAWAALRAAALEDDIRAMPMDIRTIVPEDGAGFSVGQKQRLLIARALARKPRILLFDEATSALDNRSQATVQAALKKLNVTRIVIAHRLSSVRDVEKIYVVQHGSIVESGDYEQLMAQDGVFAALSRRQLAQA